MGDFQEDPLGILKKDDPKKKSQADPLGILKKKDASPSSLGYLRGKDAPPLQANLKRGGEVGDSEVPFIQRKLPKGKQRVEAEQQHISTTDNEIKKSLQDFTSVIVEQGDAGGRSGGGTFRRSKLEDIDLENPQQYASLLRQIKSSNYFESPEGKKIEGGKERLLSLLDDRMKYITSKKGVSPTLSQLGRSIDEAVVKVIMDADRGEKVKSNPKEDALKAHHFKLGLSHVEKTNPALFNNVLMGVAQKKEISDSDFTALSRIGQDIENQAKLRASAYDPRWESKMTQYDFITSGQKKADLAGKMGEIAKEKGWKNQARFTDKQIDELAKEVEKKYGSVNQELVDDIRLNEGLIDGDDAIPKSGALDHLFSGMMQPIRGIKNTIHVWGETPAETYLRSMRLDEGGQKVPDEKGRYSDILPSERNDITTSLYRGLGQFITQAATSIALRGAISKSLGGAGIDAATKADIATYAATAIPAYVQSYGQQYEDALKRTGNPNKASLLATIDSGFTAAWEMLLPDVKVTDAAFDGVRRALGDKVASIIDKGGSPQKMAKEARPFFERATKQITTIWGKEIAEEVGTDVTDFTTELIFSPKSAEKRNLGKELAETIREAAKATALPSIFGGGLSSLKANELPPAPQMFPEIDAQKNEEATLLDVAEKAIDTDIQEFLRPIYKSNVPGMLKEASDQLHSSPSEAETARKVYGETISDIALKLYPKQEQQVAEEKYVIPGTEETIDVTGQSETIKPEVAEEATVESVKKIGVAFAPYRSRNVSSLEEDAEIRNADDYKKHQKVLTEAAKAIGVNVEQNRDTWGGYVDSDTKVPVQEVSNAVTVSGTHEQAKLLAAILGKAAPEMQDSVLIGTHDDAGVGMEYTIKTGSFENGKKAIEMLESHGLEYFTMDKDTGEILILDLDEGNTQNIINFTEALKQNGLYESAESSKINAEFIGKDDYDGIIEQSRDKTRSETGFDIDAFIQEASGKYEALKQSKQASVGEAARPDQKGETQTPSGAKQISTEEESRSDEAANPPAPPAETKRPLVYVERPSTELSYRGLQETANEFSLQDVEPRDRKSDVQLRQDAREAVNEWAEKGEYAKNIERLVLEAEGGEILTDKERVILEGHLANVKQELRDIIDKNSAEYDIKFRELMRLKEAGQRTRGEAGAALRIPTFGSIPKDVEDFLAQEAESLGVDILTSEQKQKVEKEFNDIASTTAALNERIAQLEADNARLQAEQNVKGVASKTKRGQKKDYKSERDQIFNDIKEKLRKARGETSATIIPFAKELIAISPDIARLMKSYIEQGVTELKEIVQKIHEDIKDAIPGITEKDVQEVIAGKYTEQKPTRNELARKALELRQEAKLLAKIEELEKGISAQKNEVKKNQESKRIAELKQKVKSLSKESTSLSAVKANIKNEIDKIENQIKNEDYSKPEKKKPIILDKEARALRDKLIALKQKRDARILLQERQKESLSKKGMRTATEVLNVPRTLMTIMDFSGLLRQNIFFSVSHPGMTMKALPGMFKSFTSQKVYDRWFADLKESENYGDIVDSGLAIADSLNHDLSKREEAFMSSLAEKIPIIGRSYIKVKGKDVPTGFNLVKGSERSYTMLLNKMRVDVFNYLTDKMKQRGMTFENSPKAYKAVAEYVNNATGRSDFGDRLNRIAPILNGVFFSPRLIASRINMLTYWVQPRFWKTLPKEARIDYFRGWISLLATGGTILALAKLGGAEVEDDPRSSDFGKIKSGNTRWDIWGGLQQYMRVVAQVATGKRKSTSGTVYELDGEGAFGQSRADVVQTFFRGKLAPVPAAGVDLLSGRTAIGDEIVYQWGGEEDKEVSISNYIKERMLPMTITGTSEAMKDAGVKAMLTVGIPNLFGVGTSTFDPPKPPKTFTIVDEESETKRQATLDEYAAYLSLKTKKEKELLQAIDDTEVFIDQYGDAHLTEPDDTRDVKAYKELPEDQQKKVKTALKRRASKLAKDELFGEGQDE
jgi:hypothetical protein